VTKQAKDWKGEKFTGRVLFTKFKANFSEGYGFIQPDGATDRSENVWFGSAALQGLSIEKGNLVEFVFMKEQRGAGLGAFRVWAVDPVTTLAGENDV